MALVPSSVSTVSVAGVNLTLHLPGEGTEGLRHTGRILWPSGTEMVASVLEPYRDCVSGRRVLELGAGAVGVPGLAAAVLGAEAVLLTDQAENVPSLCRNIDINQKYFSHPEESRTLGCDACPQDQHCTHVHRAPTEAQPLHTHHRVDHDDDDDVLCDIIGGKDWTRKHVTACALEWADEALPSTVMEFAPNLVLCADCVFDGTEAVLAHTLDLILRAFPEAEVWVMNIVILALRKFKRELAARGLAVARLDVAAPVSTGTHPNAQGGGNSIQPNTPHGGQTDTSCDSRPTVSAEGIAKVRWRVTRLATTTKHAES